MRAWGMFQWIVVMALSCGCGRPPVGATGEPGQGNNTPATTAPSLLMATPASLAVGDQLVVLGKDFLPKKQGQVDLLFRGAYTTDTYERQPVDLTVHAVVVNSGKLSWRLWPNIVFHKNGDRLGRFSGTLTAINNYTGGKALSSAPLPLTLTIMPSLIPRIRAHNSSCAAPIVRLTREKTSISLGAEVVGLRAATKASPLLFTWSLPVGPWSVQMKHQGADLVPTSGVVTVVDRVTSGTTSTLTPGGKGSYQVRLGQSVYAGVTITDLKTGSVPETATSLPIKTYLEVSDAVGKRALLAITLEARRKADVFYAGKIRLREHFAPIRVTDCIPGGDIGRQLTYSEDKSESRARSLSCNYNGFPGYNVPSNPFALGINFSKRFGLDISATVSSSKSKSLAGITGHILPGDYGMFYRQTLKLEHVGPLLVTTACGQVVSMGEILITDWRFVGELAQGPSCPPQSKLPGAEKYH